MTKTVQDIIGDWLDREQRTQSYLARRAGISEWTISRLMLKRHTPTSPTLRKLEKAMELPAGTLQDIVSQQKPAEANGQKEGLNS